MPVPDRQSAEGITMDGSVAVASYSYLRSPAIFANNQSSTFLYDVFRDGHCQTAKPPMHSHPLFGIVSDASPREFPNNR